MTFVSTVSALGMMPLWIFLLGSWLSEDDLIIPYGQLMMTLVTLVLPICLGMWIRFRFEKGAKIMKAIIVPFTLLTVLFIFTVNGSPFKDYA
jgi:predicted Na+-dependent transporter